MRRQLHNLRQKPEQVRQKYAFMAAGTATLAIFLVWGTTLVLSKPLAYNAGDEPQQQEATESPFQQFTQSFQTGLAGVGASFEDVQNVAEQGRFEGEARLEIVETERSSSIEEENERETVYTF